MLKKKHRWRNSMAFNITGAIVFVLVLFGVVVSTIGYVSFTTAFKKEYSLTTYHMADTAATLVNGDNLVAYLSGLEPEEYQRTRRYLNAYCKKMSVSLVYVILVDTTDYGRFVSVFNSVDNSVDNSEYVEWELGYRRNTTNNEYREKYRAIYAKEVPFETVYRLKPNDGSHPHVTTMVPVMNSSDEVAGILCIQRPASELRGARRPYMIHIAISTILLAFLSALSASAFIRKQFVKPVRKVSEEATRFARENIKGEPLGEISRFDEISSLADSIDTMETDMVNYINHLTAATAERERITAELSVASTIQENSLPNSFPAFPDRKDFDIYAFMRPAKEVGGDFYNFFFVDEDHLALVLGDVSGKGIAAALFMMVTNILLREKTSMGGKPAEILSFINDKICEHNRAEMFVTVWLGIVELSTGKVIAANAGHDDAAICRSGGSFELFRTKHGLVMGAFPDQPYVDFEIVLEKGDKLFLYTDGVTEATDKDDRLFSTDRMLAALNEFKEEPPEGILQGIFRRVNEFAGDVPQFDDLTMLCFELKEEKP